jgi:hypothetical protein
MVASTIATIATTITTTTSMSTGAKASANCLSILVPAVVIVHAHVIVDERHFA